MALKDASEKFYRAVRTLAITESDIKSRLTDAAVNELVHVNAESDLPENLREQFNQLLDKFKAQGSIPATIAYMTTREASNTAAEVVSLYDQIVKESSRQ